MKSLLAKIAIRKAIGIYLGEQELAVCKVAVTPLGIIEIASASQPYQPDELPDALDRILAPLLDKRRRIPVAIGLPGSRLFFSTRPTAHGASATPEAMLQKTLCSANIAVEDLVVDSLTNKANRLAVASVAACRRKYMAHVVGILGRLGVRPFRAEPAPCALTRLAAREHRSPRRAKIVMRVFLNATHGLAVLVSNDIPLAWRAFLLSAGSEKFAILSAARTLRTQHQHYGLEASLDYAMIHGRPDLQERLRQEHFPTEIGTRVLWYEGPGLDEVAMARGLAMGCAVSDAPGFDLSRTLKARASIREIFPWGDLAFTGILVGAMGLVMGSHAVKLDESYAVEKARSSRYKCASANIKELDKQAKDMATRIDAVRKFLETRMLWTSYTRDIQEQLPAATILNSFDGQCELATSSKKGAANAAKKSLMLRATVPIAQDGSTPREVDAFLTALRNSALLKKNFASVELTDLKRIQSRGNDSPQAVLTVIALPKTKGGASATPEKGTK